MSDLFPLQALVFVCGTVAFVASLRFLGRFLEMRKERSPQVLPSDMADRLLRIEQTVEATAIEVERVAEANRFMAKLLSERTAPMPAVPKAYERIATPH